MRPTLLTFDVFGTVLDWRRGLREALAPREVADEAFDRIVDVQGRLETGAFRPYADIVAESLVEVLGVDAARARSVGEHVGEGAVYGDSSEALARLMRVAPCVAMTNSDRAHRAQVESQLGFAMSDWYCAEDTQIYKPAPAFWHHVARAHGKGVRFDKRWWHVSAYADYDLDVARSLGLTAVFIQRPHHRKGSSDHAFRSLLELAEYVEAHL